MSLARSADVVVIGGGIIGLSIAYQLARRRAGRVVVLEKTASVGEGSTGGSSACIRLRYSQDAMVRLAQDGMRAYQHWADFTGLAEPRASYEATGVLWMMAEPRAVVERDVARLRAVGARAQHLDAAAVRDRFPALSTCGVAFDPGAEREHVCADSDHYLFEEEGGYCGDPVGATRDLLDAALQRGTEVRFRSRVVGLRVRGGRIEGVDLDDGSGLDSPIVVNAAGPWCNVLNELAGLALDWTLRPSRVQVLFRALLDEPLGPLPLTPDAAGGIYFRPDARGQQILVGSIRPEDERETISDPDAFDASLDAEMQQRLLLALHHRLPGLSHRGRLSGFAALYTMNEQDVHPLVGPSEIQGFLLANGFSGHGFKLAPAIGSMLAQWITGERVDYDSDVPVDFLSPGRASLAVREKNVLA